MTQVHPNLEHRPVQVALAPDQLEHFEREGYLIVRGLYSSAEAAQIREAFMDAARDGPVPGLSDTPKSADPNDPLAFYPRMMNPHRHAERAVGRVALEFLLAKRLEPILRTLLGEEPLGAQTMFYFKPPGARGQELHQDNFYLRVKPGTCLAAWLAVDDVDEENGGMKVVPGTHRDDIVCPEDADASVSFTREYVPVPSGKTAVHANMRAGDVLFFGGSLIHGSTPNTSATRFRRSLIAHYVPRSSEAVSHWYKPLLSFKEEHIEVAASSDGGPCGSSADAPH
jgi:ectoine hydroxylase-related dioxygenase (phytanoyl-CoA dioxygenase family)